MHRCPRTAAVNLVPATSASTDGAEFDAPCRAHRLLGQRAPPPTADSLAESLDDRRFADAGLAIRPMVVLRRQHRPGHTPPTSAGRAPIDRIQGWAGARRLGHTTANYDARRFPRRRATSRDADPRTSTAIFCRRPFEIRRRTRPVRAGRCATATYWRPIRGQLGLRNAALRGCRATCSRRRMAAAAAPRHPRQFAARDPPSATARTTVARGRPVSSTRCGRHTGLLIWRAAAAWSGVISGFPRRPVAMPLRSSAMQSSVSATFIGQLLIGPSPDQLRLPGGPTQTSRRYERSSPGRSAPI